jgi:hypothetical protein
MTGFGAGATTGDVITRSCGVEFSFFCGRDTKNTVTIIAMQRSPSARYLRDKEGII